MQPTEKRAGSLSDDAPEVSANCVEMKNTAKIILSRLPNFDAMFDRLD